MSVLSRKEIEKRLHNGELIRNPRVREDGQFDIENDSYDLAAGTAVWKHPSSNSDSRQVNTLSYLREPGGVAQPTITVQPGQMIFLVTLEDILMPSDLCGTVYSRNKLALSGILALNAGHVDSGYEGPIVIRLINLRAIPWTLTLGYPIFTITFQTVDTDPGHDSSEHYRVSQEDVILRVRETADAALSNALYDLYALNVDQRLNEYKTDALAEFRREMDDKWVPRDKIWSVLLSTLASKIVAATVVLSMVAAAVFAGIAAFDIKF